MSLYEGYKVLGPYKRPDNRYHVYLDKDGKRKTISYPKYLIEMHIGRHLTKDEIVHHKNGDVTDNSLDNLEVMLRKEHSRQHSIKYTDEVVRCAECGTIFIMPREKVVLRKVEQRRGKAKRGPFCSFSCRGKGSHKSA